MNRFILLAAGLSVLATTACSDGSSDVEGDSVGSGEPAADTGTGSGDMADSGTPEADGGTPAERCVYPQSRDRLQTGEVFPDYAWDAAFLGDTSLQGGFDLYDFHCSREYDQYDTLIVIVTTVWCPYCPGMMEYVDALSERLTQEGALVLFLEAQDRSGGPINTQGAQNHISQYTPNNSGIRVGDEDNFDPNAVASNRSVRAFPTAWIIRRRDMMMITDSSLTNYYLPFVEVAMDPEADWTEPPQPTIIPDFPSNCGPEDEEEFEGANNRPEGAPDISASFETLGGVCDPNPDYYNVTIPGRWKATLRFLHSEGDLDMYIWDTEASAPLTDAEGNPVGSDSTNNVEEFEYDGPGLLMVYGFSNATASYELTIEPVQ